MARFVVELSYGVTRAQRESVHSDHAAYLTGLAERGVLLLGGPLVDTNSGLLLYEVADRAELDTVLASEPYVRAGFVTATHIREWKPRKGSLTLPVSTSRSDQVAGPPTAPQGTVTAPSHNQPHNRTIRRNATTAVKFRRGGTVSLRRELLHPAIGDPQGDAMRMLAETAGKFPDALSFSAGAPHDGNHDVAKLPYYLDRYLQHLRESGVPDKRIERLLFQYGPVNGFIQDEVARMLRKDEGIDVPPESIMITNGAQDAMIVALRGLLATTDDVLLTAVPSYVGILGAARMLGVPVHGFPEGPDGLEPDALSAAARGARAAGKRAVVAYVSPDFSNPSGTRLSLDTRRRVLEVAAEENLMLIEDNAYGLFARDGDELPTLKSLDTNRSVLYVGSFAKSAFPGARLGFLVADQPVASDEGTRTLAEELSKAKSMFSIGTSSLSQAIVGGILVEHDFDLRAATRELSRIYLERLETTLRCLTEHFPPERYLEHRVRWNVPHGGFFLTLEVGFTADFAAVERCARDYGVSWAPMSMFYPDSGGEHAMRLGFSSLNPADIRRAIPRLARFIADTPIEPTPEGRS